MQASAQDPVYNTCSISDSDHSSRGPRSSEGPAPAQHSKPPPAALAGCGPPPRAAPPCPQPFHTSPSSSPSLRKPGQEGALRGPRMASIPPKPRPRALSRTGCGGRGPALLREEQASRRGLGALAAAGCVEGYPGQPGPAGTRHLSTQQRRLPRAFQATPRDSGCTSVIGSLLVTCPNSDHSAGQQLT